MGVTLLGLAYAIVSEGIIEKQLWSKQPFHVVFIGLMFAATIASLVLLYRARQRHWRAIWATLTGISLVVGKICTQLLLEPLC